LTSQFSARVLAAIAAALEKYGEAVNQVLIWNFEKETKLGAADISRKPQVFVDCIYRIFGPSGATIELNITEEMRKEFKLGTTDISGFVKAVEMARSKALREELMDR